MRTDFTKKVQVLTSFGELISGISLEEYDRFKKGDKVKFASVNGFLYLGEIERIIKNKADEKVFFSVKSCISIFALEADELSLLTEKDPRMKKPENFDDYQQSIEDIYNESNHSKVLETSGDFKVKDKVRFIIDFKLKMSYVVAEIFKIIVSNKNEEDLPKVSFILKSGYMFFTAQKDELKAISIPEEK